MGTDNCFGRAHHFFCFFLADHHFFLIFLTADPFLFNSGEIGTTNNLQLGPSDKSLTLYHVAVGYALFGELETEHGISRASR